MMNDTPLVRSETAPITSAASPDSATASVHCTRPLWMP